MSAVEARVREAVGVSGGLFVLNVALVGWAAALDSGDTIATRILLAAITAGIGAAICAVFGVAWFAFSATPDQPRKGQP